MTEKMVRCARCHDVFDANDEMCPRCGTTYQPPAALPEPSEGFVTKYVGYGYQEPASLVIESAPRSGPGLLVALGVAFVIVALVSGVLFYVNAFGTSSPAPTQQAVVARTPTPTPPPTLPASVAKSMAQFTDPRFSARIYINTRATVSARVTNTNVGYTLISSLDAVVEAGNEAGTVTIGGVSLNFTLINNELSLRSNTTGRYSPASSIPPYYLLLPVFDLTDAKMLRYVGDTTGDTGETLNHLVSTPWWTPDASKLAVLDVSTLRQKIEKVSLDLYVTLGGIPVSATFNAWTDTSSGEHLVQVVTTYVFTSVGSAGPIVAPTG